MISIEEVKHIAGLAKIQFSEKELKGLQKELSSILDYFNKLKEVDVENVEPTSHSIVLKNVMREDRPVKKDPQMSKKLLELAPQRKGRFIKVKSVL